MSSPREFWRLPLLAQNGHAVVTQRFPDLAVKPTWRFYEHTPSSRSTAVWAPEMLVAVHTTRLSCGEAEKAPIFTPVQESSGESKSNMRSTRRRIHGYSSLAARRRTALNIWEADECFNYFSPSSIGGFRYWRTDIRPRVFVSSADTSARAVDRARKDPPARTLQGIHGGGVEMLYRCAPTR